MSIAPGPLQVGLTQVAASALLTLQLRAAMREAEAAEAEEASLDLTAEQDSMRARLESIVATRRAALEREIAVERAAADDLVRRAHTVAEQIRSDAEQKVQEILTSRSVAISAHDDDPAAGLVADVVDPMSMVDLEPTPIDPAPGLALDVAPGKGSEANVIATIDPEAFARVFAAVLVTVLDEKFTEWQAAGSGPLRLVPHAATDAESTMPRSRWKGFMHLDILLMTIAAAILMVLLFAWLG